MKDYTYLLILFCCGETYSYILLSSHLGKIGDMPLQGAHVMGFSSVANIFEEADIR